MRAPLARPQRRAGVPETGKLLTATRAFVEVRLEAHAIVADERVERVERRQFVKVFSHTDPKPDSPAAPGRFGPYSRGSF